MKKLLTLISVALLCLLCCAGCQATGKSALVMKDEPGGAQQTKKLTPAEAKARCTGQAKTCVQAVVLRAQAVNECKASNTAGGKALEVTKRALTFLLAMAANSQSDSSSQFPTGFFAPLSKRCQKMIRANCRDKYRVCLTKATGKNAAGKQWQPKRDSDTFIGNYKKR